jgi:hypothetical protein
LHRLPGNFLEEKRRMKNTEEMKHFQTAAPATLSTCPWHIPASPRSNKQKYRLTPKGKAWLAAASATGAPS